MYRDSLLLLMVVVSVVSAQPPETRKAVVRDTYHGVEVKEDYRWLEDWSSPEVKAWSEGQNKYARSILDRLSQADALRCGLCGKIHTAQLPVEVGPAKYDPTVASIIATLRYGQGLPWNRIQHIQHAAGIPLPASVQWEQELRMRF